MNWTRKAICTISMMSFVFLGAITATWAAPANFIRIGRLAVDWQELDPSIPEHAAILRWQKIVLSNDYEAWRRQLPEASFTYNLATRAVFDRLRKSMPRKLLITAKSHHTNPNGSKDHSITGCGEAFYAKVAHPVRVQSGMTPVMENGEWKISVADIFTEADYEPCPRVLLE